MLPRSEPDRIQIAFNDDHLLTDPGLILPVTLAKRLGLGELVGNHVDLGNAPVRANTRDKMLTLVASALTGSDCIDDSDMLRTGGTASAIGCVVKAPSTLGTSLRSFRWGLGCRAGSGDGPSTWTRTISETYCLVKEGARHLGYTGQRGYHPLLAVAAGTGDVLMVWLRAGRAHTARGAAHFLQETVGRVRYARASEQLTMRADSGFYTHAIATVCRKLDVRFFITIRQHTSLQKLIEGIPEADWTPVPYWMDGAANVAETSFTPLSKRARHRTGASHRQAGQASPRLSIGPVCQLQLPCPYYRPGGRHPGTGGRPSPPRRHRECHPRPQVRRGAGPSPLGAFSRQRRLAGSPMMIHNLAHRTVRIGLCEQLLTTKTPRRRFFSLVRRVT